jgi:hypothetical protein
MRISRKTLDRVEMKEPKFRCGTRKAILEISTALELAYDESMQDWPYEVAQSSDIEKYLQHYGILSDDDEKFVLMEAIIQATTDQKDAKNLEQCWKRTREFLLTDQHVHEYTIFYWCCFENEDMNNCWETTPLMRDLWFEIRKLKNLFTHNKV